MTLLSSLRSRIFLTSALLAVLSIGAAIYLVSVRVTRELEASMRRELDSNAALVDQLRTTRAQTFTAMARLMADAPKLKAAVDTNDPPTVQDTAEGYQTQLNSNVLIVTGKAGGTLATVGAAPSADLVAANEPALRTAMAGRETVSLIPRNDGILHMATVPIMVGLSHPDILGTLSLGFLLDDGFAEQLKQLTGSDIAFSMNGSVLASTLPRARRDELSTLLSAVARPQLVTLGAQEYAALAVPMSRPVPEQAAGLNAGPIALILRSRTEQLHFLDTIHTELAVTAVVAVLFATLLSFAVARTITRPLAAITSVMREVASSGDLTRKIVLRRGQRWNDADAQLLANTFNTLTSSIARAQREMSQKERLTSLGRLSSVIAHEIRNPLMIIKAALHTLRLPALTPDSLREAVTDIDEEVARLNRIVNDVLDLSRPIHFEPAPTDVNRLCAESVQAAQATPGPAVAVQLDGSIPVLVTDPERLRLALVNLIVNARQAVGAAEERAASESTAGSTDRQATSGVPAPVTVTTRHDADTVSITVRDRGVGINREDLPRVFDPYFTTKRGGTGLGLPIAKNIVEGLGGTISVASERTRGTDIVITLPLDRGQPRIDHRQSAAGDRPAGRGPFDIVPSATSREHGSHA